MSQRGVERLRRRLSPSRTVEKSKSRSLMPEKMLRSSTTATLVLDTNVVLDWLWFRDPNCAVLNQAIQFNSVRWLATSAMRDEFRHVVGRGLPTRHAIDAASALQSWDRWAHMVAYDPEGSAPSGMRCTDPDDQKFIDLAWSSKAEALLSRDRAVLRLARRAAVQGLHIVTADVWRQRRLQTYLAQTDLMPPTGERA